MKPEVHRRRGRLAFLPGAVARGRAWLWASPGAWWLLLAVLLPGLGAVPADDLPPRPEHEIKALYVYNFTKYISWPSPTAAGAPAEFTIGVLAPQDFVNDLELITRDKRRDGGRFVIRRLDQSAGVKGCQILVLMTSERGLVTNLLAAVRSEAVLTVGEGDDFVGLGGMVSFVRRKDKVKLQIAPEAARLAGLELNAKLLQVAELVPPPPPSRE